MDFLYWNLRYRRTVMLSALVLVALAVPGLMRLRIDNRPEVFFLQDDTARSRYLRFQIDFGRDQSLRLVIRSSELWTPEGLEWLRTLEEEVDSWFGVFGSAGIYGHHRWRLPSWPPADIEAFRDEVVSDRLDLGGGLITPDGQLATLAVVLYNLEPSDEVHVLDQLERLCRSPPIEAECRLVGLPILSRTLDASAYSFSLRYYPLLFLLAVLLLGIVFRTVRDVVAALGFVAICETLVLGLAGYSGMSLNFVNMVLVPILFVVALATSTHIHLGYRRLQALDPDPAAALAATYREKAWPVFWAGVTTAAGFGSMVLSDAPPIQTLGSWTAFGLAVITVASFTLYPCLLATLLPEPVRKPDGMRLPSRLSRLGYATAAFAIKRRMRIVAVFAATSSVFLAGTYRLREETGLLRHFGPEDPTRQEIRQLETLGIASLSAEMIVKSPADRPDSFRDPDPLVRLAEAGQKLQERPEIYGVLGGGDLLRNVAKWTSQVGLTPPDWKKVEDQLRRLPKIGKMYRNLVTESGGSARLSLQVEALDYRQLEPVLDEAVTSIERLLPGYEVWITGRFPLILSTQRHLLSTMVSSLGLTLLVIMSLLFFVLGPGRTFLSAVAVNLWPVFVLIGTMAWLGFPLDSTTIMVGSVVLALAVDDTLHTLGHLHRERSDKLPGLLVCRTLKKTAPAQILSSAILAGGFLLCSTTSIVPISQFCFLTGVAIAAALAGDLLFFPALLGGELDDEITSN